MEKMSRENPSYNHTMEFEKSSLAFSSKNFVYFSFRIYEKLPIINLNVKTEYLIINCLPFMGNIILLFIYLFIWRLVILKRIMWFVLINILL